MNTFQGKASVQSWGLWVFDCLLVGNLWEKHKLRLSSSLQGMAAAKFRFKDKAWNIRTQCKTSIFGPLCPYSVEHMGTLVCDFAFAELRFELLASLFLHFKQPCNSICVCFNFTLSIKSILHDDLERWPLAVHRNLFAWHVTLSYFSPANPRAGLDQKYPGIPCVSSLYLNFVTEALEVVRRGRSAWDKSRSLHQPCSHTPLELMSSQAVTWGGQGGDE